MAVNVYTPGCHLLCHDDVIGSRRVSYILYLTDPDSPWKEEWGGALRLYPTHTAEGIDERPLKVPEPDWTVSIPPRFNQLSFFAVQPGESFHDVEEVYAHEKDDKIVRMAISGWYHIPQEGEPGYESDAAKLAEQSSLQQLQGKGDRFDLPQIDFAAYESVADQTEKANDTGEEQRPTDEEFDFLIKYLNPEYLTPDTLRLVSDAFTDNCALILSDVFTKGFADRLREFLTSEDEQSPPTGDTTVWNVARPPYRHRYLYQEPSKTPIDDSLQTPLYDLLNNLLPSVAFRKWLQLATRRTILSRNLLARRFRRGQDYTLATSYDDENPRLEICLAITPTPGWEGGDEPSENNGNANGDGQVSSNENPAVGGYLAYMAPDEEVNGTETGSDHGVNVPTDLSTGGRASGSVKTHNSTSNADPAVYQAADDEDEGLLFSMPAGWNQLGLVLRDKGTMRFVKYVSKQAKGDRWDIMGEFEIKEEDDEEATTEGVDEPREEDDEEATTERADEPREEDEGEATTNRPEEPREEQDGETTNEQADAPGKGKPDHEAPTANGADPSPTIDTRGGFHGLSEDSEDSD